MEVLNQSSDLVQSAGVERQVVELDSPRVGDQPLSDVGAPVGVEVIEDEVNYLARREVGVEEVQEGQEDPMFPLMW